MFQCSWRIVLRLTSCLVRLHGFARVSTSQKLQFKGSLVFSNSSHCCRDRYSVRKIMVRGHQRKSLQLRHDMSTVTALILRILLQCGSQFQTRLKPRLWISTYYCEQAPSFSPPPKTPTTPCRSCQGLESRQWEIEG